MSPIVPNGLTIFGGIQIDITHRCNLWCDNCDRACGDAPTQASMTPDQIQHFVEETLAVGRFWKHIHVLGGEPTLHPQLLQILEILRPLLWTPRLTEEIVLFTNGYGALVQDVLKTVPSWVRVVNSQKTSPHQKFSPHHLAPVDLENEISPIRWCSSEDGQDQHLWFPSCLIPYECGMALTRHGYYPCAAGATVQRVMGVGLPALMRLPVDEIMRQSFSNNPSIAQLCQIGETLCRFCGHATGFTVERAVASGSWRRGFERYKMNPPQLAVYGEHL